MDEKDLTIKDLCARIPYGVMVHVHIDKDCIDAHNHIYSDYDRPLDTEFFNWYVGLEGVTLKPYLRPMSSMTVHERRWYFELTKREILDGGYTTDNLVVNVDDVEKFIDWLNAHHFDYRGFIEKGLAIEAPEGMYQIQ